MIGLVFGLGVGLGFLIGVVTNDAIDLYRSSRKEAPMRRPRDLLTRSRVTTLAIVGFVLLQFTVGVLLIVTYATASRYTQCSATWQRDFGASYRARSQAAAEQDKALDAVVLAVAADDRNAFRKALAEYVEVRDRQDRERRANPLPEPPQVLCGTPEGGAR